MTDFTPADLEHAFAVTRGVLVNVKPEQLSAPTPCASWDVHALVNHIVGGTYFFAASVRDEAMPEGEPPDFAAGDFVAAYDQGAAQAVAAFAAPGALERTVTRPFTMPAAGFIRIAATDAYAHGWDLARATGQSSDLDPELATQLLENAKVALPQSFRGPDPTAPFGEVVEPSSSACAADRLAAFLGRKV